MEYIKEQGYCVDEYIEWVNDYVRLETFAEHKQMSYSEAEKTILIGKFNFQAERFNINNEIEEVK